MSQNSLRVYFSDRLEQVRYACDVEVDHDSPEPLRIGRGTENEVVLPGLQVPDLAATVRREGGRWWLTGRDGVCRLDGRPLAAGESVAWSRGQELQVAHYTVEFDDYEDDHGPARVDRERLERAGFDLIDRVHQALLPRIPSEPCLDPRPEREKMLIELEHSIEEIAEPMLDETPDVAEHLAGRCIRDELLKRRIDPGSSGPSWATMIAVVPELERSLRRVVDGFERCSGWRPSRASRPRSPSSRPASGTPGRPGPAAGSTTARGATSPAAP
ncbi:MAG: FHA domain-containing protein [Isosphaeraceae bacterium]